jgi:putative tricarboxylic transport membrane protein
MKRPDQQFMMNDNQFRPRCFMRLCAAIFSLLLIMAADSKAADPSAAYPSRPIEYVTQSAPGSHTDVYCRTISDVIQKEKLLNQPIVIMNKQGSGGAVASGYLFERKGNPYIIQAVTTSSFLLLPLLEKLPYNYKSFTPVANMILDGNVLVVRSDSPFKTANDIIAEAKKRPKELIQGGGSFSSAASMMGRSLQRLKGVQWNFISFAGVEPEALLNVLSGNVHFAFLPPSIVLDHARKGKVRALLTAAPKRFPEFKDVPTMQETGMGEPIVSYRGIVGPPNMPDYAVKKLEAAFKKVMESDRFKKYMGEMMMMPWWLSSDEYSKLLDKSNDQWKELLKEVDLLKK